MACLTAVRTAASLGQLRSAVTVSFGAPVPKAVRRSLRGSVVSWTFYAGMVATALVPAWFLADWRPKTSLRDLLSDILNLVALAFLAFGIFSLAVLPAMWLILIACEGIGNVARRRRRSMGPANRQQSMP